MINHIRTLLLNKSAAQAGLDSGVAASEYVPADFAPLTIPAALLPVRAALRLDDPSAFRLNHTLAYLMRALHTPDMAPYTALFDSRHTYDCSDAQYLALRTDFVSVEDFGGGDNVHLQYSHNTYAELPDALKHQSDPLKWVVRRMNDSAVTVQLGNAPPAPIALKFVDGRSQAIALVPQYLDIYVVSGAGTLDHGFTFTVTVTAPPVFDTVQLLNRLRKLDGGSVVHSELFMPWADYAAEIEALAQIWRHAPEFTSKLAAAVLGYAYRLERARRGVAIPERESTLRRYAT